MQKIKTNNAMVKAFVKELDNAHPLLMALFRERVIKIAEITERSIEEEPGKWENQIVSPQIYKELCKTIHKHLDF